VHASASELLEVRDNQPQDGYPNTYGTPELFQAKIGTKRQIIMPEVGVPIRV
jgi:hypothetical protein